MKYTSTLLIFLLFIISCSDNNNPVNPPEQSFEPTGFLIKDYSLDRTLIYCNKGEIDSSIAERLEFDVIQGERTYDLVFTDEDGIELEDPDVVDYTVLIDKTEPEDLNRKIAAVSSIGFDLSITPLDPGTTEFKVILLKNGEEILNSPYMEIYVYE